MRIEVGHFHGLQFRLQLAFLSFVDWNTYILTNYFISKIPLDLFIMKYETVNGYHGYRIWSLFIYFIPMVVFFLHVCQGLLIIRINNYGYSLQYKV